MNRAFFIPIVLAAAPFAARADAAETSPDLGNGQKIFATCAACHQVDGPAKTGPDLRGVVGREAGKIAGFRFSRALRTSGLVWTEAQLDAFLAEPQAAVPGNAMPFPGLPDAKQRLDLIAVLKTLK